MRYCHNLMLLPTTVDPAWVVLRTLRALCINQTPDQQALGLCAGPNPNLGVTTHPIANSVGYGSTLNQLVNSTAPDKGMGLTLTIPLRNRSAQADQIQAQLEYRQAEMRLQQLENQVRIEVRNAQFVVTQNRAAVDSAQAAAALAKESLDAEQKKYALGASTTTLVLQAQRDMAQAQSNQVTAMANYQKSRIELDRVTGLTLEHNGIMMDDAVRGAVNTMPHVPYAVPANTVQAAPQQPAQPQQ